MAEERIPATWQESGQQTKQLLRELTQAVNTTDQKVGQLTAKMEGLNEILSILEFQFRRAVINYFDQQGKPIAKETGMPVTITDIQAVTAIVTVFSARGNVIPLAAEQTVDWTVDDSKILSLTSNPDHSASIAATGPLGTANLRVIVRNQDGSGTPVMDAMTVTYSIPSRAEITFGEPTDVSKGPPPVPERPTQPTEGQPPVSTAPGK